MYVPSNLHINTIIESSALRFPAESGYLDNLHKGAPCTILRAPRSTYQFAFTLAHSHQQVTFSLLSVAHLFSTMYSCNICPVKSEDIISSKINSPRVVSRRWKITPVRESRDSFRAVYIQAFNQPSGRLFFLFRTFARTTLHSETLVRRRCTCCTYNS